jgi:hypothetical protein
MSAVKVSVFIESTLLIDYTQLTRNEDTGRYRDVNGNSYSDDDLHDLTDLEKFTFDVTIRDQDAADMSDEEIETIVRESAEQAARTFMETEDDPSIDGLDDTTVEIVGVDAMTVRGAYQMGNLIRVDRPHVSTVTVTRDEDADDEQ